MNKKIILGTWPLSGDYGQISLTEVERVILESIERGIYQIDTAPSYGGGFIESSLGLIVPQSRYENILIDTKVGNLPLEGKSFKLSKLKKSFEHSLKRLRREKINTLYIHNPRLSEMELMSLYEFLDDLKSKGYINKTGVSLARDCLFSDKTLNHFDVIQDDFNLLYINNIFKANQVNAEFISRSPFASGLLSGKICLDSKFDPTDHRSGWLKGERLKSLLSRVKKIQDTFPSYSIIEVASAFVLGQQNINKTIFGFKSIKQLEVFLDSIVKTQLSIIDMKEVEHLFYNDFGLENQINLGY